MLAPTLAPGYVLTYDMVFTPRQPLLAESVGLGSALPRAVPVDAVVAVLTTVIPGDVLQKAILLLTVWLAGYGAARLLPVESTAPRLVAATAYAWNAYVAERLFIGHWSVLVAYACLPWVVAAGLRVRRGEPGGWPVLVLACAPAVLVPTGGVLAAGAAIAAGGRRRLAGTLGLAVVLNAPWWLPGLLHGLDGGGGSDPAGVDAFAARAEGPGGAVVSVLGLGGIWNAGAVPGSRSGAVVPLVAALLLTAGAYGLWRLARPRASEANAIGPAWGRGPALALGGLAAAGLLLAVAGAVPGLSAVPRWLVANVPGAGLVRDGQKWAAWWALPVALGAGFAADRLGDALDRIAHVLGRTADALGRAVRGPAVPAVVAACAVLPLALLPDLAWGGLGRLQPVEYPREWYAVRAALEADTGKGDVLVLPFQPFRQFGWNDRRTQLDPAPRFLPRSVIVDDTLVVGDRALRGEDRRGAEVGAASGDPARLAALGVGWVLVEHATPGRVDEAALGRLTTVHEGQWLTLYRVPGPIADPPAGATGTTAARAAVIAADAAVLILLLAAAVALLRRRLPAGTFRSVAERGAN
jgi:hypothetical protein